MSTTPVRFGSMGLGGYALTIWRMLEECGKGEAPLVLPVAVSTSSFTRHPELVAELRGKGVKVVASIEELLAQDIEAVWNPLSIDQHLPATEQALAAGKAVMCEKPAAGCVDDVDAMIAARDKYHLPVAIGYQTMYDPCSLTMKRELLAGKIGALQSATLYACWPRYHQYYSRNDWAARYRKNGRWVMDSPVNNALAHYLNIALFLMGKGELDAAVPVKVEAELYRANAIESDDTVCLRVHLQGGATLLVMLTHACQKQINPQLEIRGEKGTLSWASDKPAGVIQADGQPPLAIAQHSDVRRCMVQRFCDLVRGRENKEIGLSTLENARAQTVVINAANEAAAVVTIPAEHIRQLKNDIGILTYVEGMDAAIIGAIARGQMLSESGLAPWAQPAGSFTIDNYKHFAGPKTLALAGKL